MSNKFKDLHALLVEGGEDGARSVSAITRALVDDQNLKAPDIVEVEISLIPPSAQRILASSDRGELAKLVLSAGRSVDAQISAWIDRIRLGLGPVFGDQPVGEVDCIVWLQSKKASHAKKLRGTIGIAPASFAGDEAAEIIAGGIGAARLYVRMVKDRFAGLEREVHTLRVQAGDLVRQIADMGNRGLAVGEAIPGAMTAAIGVANMNNSGHLIGQVVGGAISAWKGGGNGGGAAQVEFQAPPRPAYQLRTDAVPPAVGADGKPVAPMNAEQLAMALDAAALADAGQAVAAWIQAHPKEAKAILKRDADLQKALGIPPGAMAFL